MANNNQGQNWTAGSKLLAYADSQDIGRRASPNKSYHPPKRESPLFICKLSDLATPAIIIFLLALAMMQR